MDVLNVVDNWLFNLNEFSDGDDFVDCSDDLNDLGYFDSFDNDLVDNLWYSDDFFLDDWYFDPSVNNLFDLLD